MFVLRSSVCAAGECRPVENPVCDQRRRARAASLHRSRRAETSGAGDRPERMSTCERQVILRRSPQPGFYLARLRHTRSVDRLDRRDRTRIRDDQAFSGRLVCVSYRAPIPATNDRQVAQLVGSPTRPGTISTGYATGFACFPARGSTNFLRISHGSGWEVRGTREQRWDPYIAIYLRKQGYHGKCWATSGTCGNAVPTS
jgi:hypothetical protein